MNPIGEIMVHGMDEDSQPWVMPMRVIPDGEGGIELRTVEPCPNSYYMSRADALFMADAIRKHYEVK